MEFWGAEVKNGQIFKGELNDDGSRILHLSQVVLGEVTGNNKKDKGNQSICVYLKFNNQKFVIGTLSQDKFPQIPLDLVLHGNFELSHTWKNGSVYFSGYYVDNTHQGGDSESEEELPEPTSNPIKPQATTASDPTTSKQATIVEPKKDEDSSDDDDEDDTSAEDKESSEDQEPDMLVNGENESGNDTDEDDSEEESSDEDQETSETQKAGSSKKRPMESATKTPAPLKKAKLVAPQKPEGKKKGGHIATPHPSRQAGKA